MFPSRLLSTAGHGALGASRSWRTAYLLLVPLAAGVVLALLPGLALKLAAVVALAGMALAVLMARRGMVLDPAWVIVAQLFLLAPVGSVLIDWGVGFSIITALVLAFVPFVLATLVAVPASRSSLLLLSPLVLLGIFAAASVLWSPAAGLGAEKLTIWLVNGFLPAATIVVLFAAKQTISWRLILVAATIYALGLLLIGEPWSEGGQRLTVFDQNPIWAARAILVGALIAILGPFPPWVKIVTAPMLILAGVLTQSLGPTVGMAAGLLAGAITALVLHSRREGRLSPGWTVLSIAMGFGLVILLSGLLDPLLGPLINDPNVTSRTSYIDASIPLFLGTPLYGMGIGGFLSTGLDSYPHNFVLEMGVELGIVGLLSLGAWTLLGLIGATRSPLAMGLVVGTGAFTLFSGSLASQAEFWMFSALAVAMVPAVMVSRSQPPRDVSTTDTASPASGARNARARPVGAPAAEVSKPGR